MLDADKYTKKRFEANEIYTTESCVGRVDPDKLFAVCKSKLHWVLEERKTRPTQVLRNFNTLRLSVLSYKGS
jgi:hypothetical protein